MKNTLFALILTTLLAPVAHFAPSAQADANSGPVVQTLIESMGGLLAETEQEKKARCIKEGVEVYAACCASANNCSNAEDEDRCNKRGNTAQTNCMNAGSPASQ